MNREILSLCCAHVSGTIDRLVRGSGTEDLKQRKRRERRLKEYRRLHGYLGEILMDNAPVGQVQ